MIKNKIKYPSEHEEQKTLFQWARNFPELTSMFAIPNGGHRNIITASRLKAEGVKSGVPDIFLPLARGKYHGLFIEIKAMKGRATDNQDIYLDNLRLNGYRAEVCHGFAEAKKAIEEYLS